MKLKLKIEKRYRKHKKVRAKIFGTVDRPRLCVFRSGKHIFAQLINDEKGQTILSSSDIELKKSKIQISKSKIKSKSKIQKAENKEGIRIGKIAIAYEVGKLIAQKAIQNKIEKVVFDRGGYKYHGRVKALAEGAREGGLKF